MPSIFPETPPRHTCLIGRDRALYERGIESQIELIKDTASIQYQNNPSFSNMRQNQKSCYLSVSMDSLAQWSSAHPKDGPAPVLKYHSSEGQMSMQPVRAKATLLTKESSEETRVVKITAMLQVNPALLDLLSDLSVKVSLSPIEGPKGSSINTVTAANFRSCAAAGKLHSANAIGGASLGWNNVLAMFHSSSDGVDGKTGQGNTAKLEAILRTSVPVRSEICRRPSDTILPIAVTGILKERLLSGISLSASSINSHTGMSTGDTENTRLKFLTKFDVRFM